MIFDRKMAIFVGIITLVAAVLLASGHIVNDDPIEDWTLTAVLGVITLAAWLWIWQSESAQSAELMVIDSGNESPQPQEWLISKEHDKKKPASQIAAQATTPKAVAASTAVDEADDLTRVEGIGPKYRDALVEAGIGTFADLAASSLEQIQQAAADAGMRNRASMETWAEQAKLAANGDWDALEKLQSELSGGRR